jgi:DNA-binding transcriptional ArsR family regulator
METTEAVDKLAALAQETRLRIFRLLIEQGPQGLHAGAIAEALALPPATLSFHVAHLVRAGLVIAPGRALHLLRGGIRGDGRPDRLPHRQLLPGRAMPAQDHCGSHHGETPAPGCVVWEFP